jgi:hypothetical protein
MMDGSLYRVVVEGLVCIQVTMDFLHTDHQEAPVQVVVLDQDRVQVAVRAQVLGGLAQVRALEQGVAEEQVLVRAQESC